MEEYIPLTDDFVNLDHVERILEFLPFNGLSRYVKDEDFARKVGEEFKDPAQDHLFVVNTHYFLQEVG